MEYIAIPLKEALISYITVKKEINLRILGRRLEKGSGCMLVHMCQSMKGEIRKRSWKDLKSSSRYVKIVVLGDFNGKVREIPIQGIVTVWGVLGVNDNDEILAKFVTGDTYFRK